MDIKREKHYFGFTSATADQWEGFVILEDETWLLVRDNGTAVDRDGKQYARVSGEKTIAQIQPDIAAYLYMAATFPEENLPEPEPIPDTTLVTLGWTNKTDKPIILPENKIDMIKEEMKTR